MLRSRWPIQASLRSIPSRISPDRVGAALDGDGSVRIARVATLERAGPARHRVPDQPPLPRATRRNASAAVIVGPQSAAQRCFPSSSQPTLTRLMRGSRQFSIRRRRSRRAFIRPRPSMRRRRVAASASIGAYAVIGAARAIGERAVIGAHGVIGDDASIGDDVVLDPRRHRLCRTASSARARIVHSGAVIGADGFGMADEGGRWLKIPQIGRVVIGDDVEIGANTTIDRGAIDDTVIEDDVKLDNQIQIGHNCASARIRRSPAASASPGSTRIGRNCKIGGAAMISGHLTSPTARSISAATQVVRFDRERRRLHRRVSGAAASRMAARRVELRRLRDARRARRARSSARLAAIATGRRRGAHASDASWTSSDDPAAPAASLSAAARRPRARLRAGQVACARMKNVTVNEPFFQGHFPDYPVMPGRARHRGDGAGCRRSWLSELAAARRQAARAVRRHRRRALQAAGCPRRPRCMLEAQCERAVRGVGKFARRATVGGELVCEAQLLAAIRDVPPVPICRSDER